MTRATWLTFLMLFVVLLVPLLVACDAQYAKELNGPDVETLARQRCSECHPLSRVTDARKAREGWQQTVERMVDHGARLNEEEQQAVVDYLSATYPAQ
jgi:hypothetical protein